VNTEHQLIIVGAGPKAMAVAAKCHVLAGLGFTVPKLHVIERSRVAAHWTGDSGYTNGLLRLGTPPEKDVGFPYQSTCWGEHVSQLVDAQMMRYSWQSFLVAIDAYSDWIDRGRPAPEHRRWAQYLQWVAETVGESITLHHGEAHRITLRGDRWHLCYRRPDGVESSVEGDGLMLTGPGKTRVIDDLPRHERVMTVETFWKNQAMFRAIGPARVAIVGAGEHAASIALKLGLYADPALKIDVISQNGMTYSRGESFRENRIYSDPEVGMWSKLSEQDKRSFIQRTDRGVFSLAAQRMLDQVSNIDIVPGKLVGATIDAASREIKLDLLYDGGREVHVCDYLVLAMGSDQLSLFHDMIDDATQSKILQRAGLDELTDSAVEPLIDRHLAVRGITPRLHLPMLAGMAQGPGFANLSCLGRLSDQLLSLYVDCESRQSSTIRRSIPIAPARDAGGHLWTIDLALDIPNNS
jgi:mycobactin lysine-N-oxygenase